MTWYVVLVGLYSESFWDEDNETHIAEHNVTAYDMGPNEKRAFRRHQK